MDEKRIIAQNIADAEALLAEGFELRYAHIKELTDRLLGAQANGEQIAEGYRALASLLGECRDRWALPIDRLFGGKNALVPFYAELDLHSRVILAREWASVADPLPLTEYRAELGGRFTIAHFGNLYADRVLAAFSDALGGVSAFPVEDYTAACEEVSDGNADFCILPIESARDGVMDRFEQMIDRYSLFMLMTCSVHLSGDNEEGDEEWIRFALLAAAPCRLTEGRSADRMQIRITPEGEALWELLLAADLLGARLLECRLSGGRSDRAASYRLTFSADEKSRSELLAYLEIGYSGYALVGTYSRLADLPLDG